MRQPTLISVSARSCSCSSAGSVFSAAWLLFLVVVVVMEGRGVSVPNTGTMRAVRGGRGVVVVVVGTGSFSSHRAGQMSTPNS